MYKVLRNFLPYDRFIKINALLKSHNIPWYYRHSQVVAKEEDSAEFFAYSFYEDNIPCSEYYNEFIKEYFQNQLEIKALINARANLLLNKGKHEACPWHTDTPYKDNMTAVYYVNENNGYTELKDDNGDIIKVESEANKILIFDSYHEHRAFSQTDTKQRIVINFNYF